MNTERIIKLSVDKSLYKEEAVLNAMYKYTEDYFVSVNDVDAKFTIVFKLKEDSRATIEKLEDEFLNELLEQQIRFNVEKDFGNIRNMIVEKAFKPLNKIK